MIKSFFRFDIYDESGKISLNDLKKLAEDLIHDEPFAILLPDDLFFSEDSCLSQLKRTYMNTNSSVIAVNRIDKNNIHKYGVISPGIQEANSIEILDIVEKPNADEAPSDIAVCGRYILTSSIFKKLKNVKPDKLGEIQITDAIKLLIEDETVNACIYEGEKFDCGSKLGFVEATIAISLRDKEIGHKVKDLINNLLTRQTSSSEEDFSFFPIFVLLFIFMKRRLVFPTIWAAFFTTFKIRKYRGETAYNQQRKQLVINNLELFRTISNHFWMNQISQG
mgnify:CR=1 FL=1